MNSYMIVIKTLNTLNALQRIIFILKRNACHVEQLNIFESQKCQQSHLSIVLNTNDVILNKCIKELHRIVEITEVKPNHINFEENNYGNI